MVFRIENYLGVCIATKPLDCCTDLVGSPYDWAVKQSTKPHVV